jgi:hypothetical protein
MKALIFMALIASGVAANARTCAIDYDKSAGQFVFSLVEDAKKRTPSVKELFDLWNANPDLYTHSKQAQLLVVDAKEGGEEEVREFKFGHLPRPNQNVQCVSDPEKKVMSDYECDSAYLRANDFPKGIDSPVEIRVPATNTELRDLLAKDMGCEGSTNTGNSGNSGNSGGSGGSSGALCTVERDEDGDFMISSGAGANAHFFKLVEIFDALNQRRSLLGDLQAAGVYIKNGKGEFVPKYINSIPTPTEGDPRCKDKTVTGYICRERDLIKTGHPKGNESQTIIVVNGKDQALLNRILGGLGCQAAEPQSNPAPAAPAGSQAPLPPPPPQRAAPATAAR